MRPWITLFVSVAIAVACLSCGKKAADEGTPASAPSAGKSGGGKGGGPGGAPGGFSPEQRARFMEMREQNKLTFELMGLIARLNRLQNEGTAKLSAEQATTLVAVLKDLKAEEKLAQTDCKEYLTAIKKELTPDQLLEIADMQSRWRGSGKGGPGGSGPPGGGASGGGLPGGGGKGAPEGTGADAKGASKGSSGKGKGPGGSRGSFDLQRPFAGGRGLERLEDLIETLEKTTAG